MKKTTVTVSILIFGLLACQAPDDAESLRRQIAQNREKIISLKQENESLQKTLNAMEGENGSRFVNVEIKEIKPETFVHHFEVNGTVEAVNESYVSTQTPGQIEEIHVQEGERVKKGDLLITLNSEVLENNIAEVKTNLKLARTVYEKRKDLWDRQIGSEVEFLSAKNNKEALEERLRALEAQRELTRISSPLTGLVERIPPKRGELASPGQLLVLVVNLKEIYINADVSERYLPVVQVGDSGEVSFPAYPDINLMVPIHKIGQVINPENRTFRIQLKMENLDGRLKPNLIAIIRLVDYMNEAAVVIPSIVIKKDRQGAYVYRVDDTGDRPVARKVYINEDISSDNRSVVTYGLDFADRVIVGGYNFIKDGTRIKIK